MHETTLDCVFHFLHSKFLDSRFAKVRVLQITGFGRTPQHTKAENEK